MSSFQLQDIREAADLKFTVKTMKAEEVWEKVFEAGADYGIKPIGLAARDTLRLEMGLLPLRK